MLSPSPNLIKSSKYQILRHLKQHETSIKSNHGLPLFVNDLLLMVKSMNHKFFISIPSNFYATWYEF